MAGKDAERRGALVTLVSGLFVLEASLYASVTPLLPHYVHELSLSKATAGLLIGSYPTGVISGALIVGRARALNPRLLTFIGLLTIAAATIAFGFSRAEVLLDSTRVMQGIGCGGIWGGGLAWLAMVTPPSARGRAFGYAFGAATFGTVLGPVIGTVATETNPPAVFAAIGLLAALLAALVWRRAAPVRRTPEQVSTGSFSPRSLGTGLAVMFVPTLALGSLNVLVPLRLSHLGASNLGVGVTFLGASLLATVVSPFAGRLSDRRGRRLPMLVGVGFEVICLATLSAPLDLAAVVVVTLAFLGCAFNLAAAPAMAYISESAEHSRLESAVPAMVLVTFAGAELIGSIGGAGLADLSSDAVSLRLLTLLCVAVFGLLGLARPSPPRHRVAGQPAPPATEGAG